jgi:hypothetical protein
MILLNLRDQIRTIVCIVPRRLLVHDLMNYGVPICAFYGNATPRRRSKHKLYLDSRMIWYVRELARHL